METGNRISLDTYCKRKIAFCRHNLRIPPAPPYEREIWHYDRVDIALQRAINKFPWSIHTNPSWQVWVLQSKYPKYYVKFHSKIKVKLNDPLDNKRIKKKD